MCVFSHIRLFNQYLGDISEVRYQFVLLQFTVEQIPSVSLKIIVVPYGTAASVATDTTTAIVLLLLLLQLLLHQPVLPLLLPLLVTLPR